MKYSIYRIFVLEPAYLIFSVCCLIASSVLYFSRAVIISAIEALQHLVIGQDVGAIFANFAVFYRGLTSESQLRWIGPEKGVIHLASAAILNALWDLWAKLEGKPLWQLLADLEPEQIVNCIDFRYITDALTRAEAIDILRKGKVGIEKRIALLRENGYPA